MKKIILTGVTGFIGGTLAQSLVRDYDVAALVRRSSLHRAINSQCSLVRQIEIDGSIERLVSILAAEKPDCVVHLASLFLSKHEDKDIAGLVESNVLFGCQILQAMAHSSCRYFINTGTYWQHFNNEDFNPVNLYSATKQAFEDIMRYYCEAEGIKAITLELYDVYGPGDPRPKLLSQLMKCFQDRCTLELSPGEQRLELVHIDDVVDAYRIALKRLLSGAVKYIERYSIRGTERMSLRELVERFEVICGENLDVHFGGRAYRAREVMEPWDRGHTLPGWSPKVSLDDGLMSLIRK